MRGLKSISKERLFSALGAGFILVTASGCLGDSPYREGDLGSAGGANSDGVALSQRELFCPYQNIRANIFHLDEADFPPGQYELTVTADNLRYQSIEMTIDASGDLYRETESTLNDGEWVAGRHVTSANSPIDQGGITVFYRGPQYASELEISLLYEGEEIAELRIVQATDPADIAECEATYYMALQTFTQAFDVDMDAGTVQTISID